MCFKFPLVPHYRAFNSHSRFLHAERFHDPKPKCRYSNSVTSLVLNDVDVNIRQDSVISTV